MLEIALDGLDELKNKIKEVHKYFGDRIDKFFSNNENINLIENNKFDDLFYNWSVEIGSNSPNTLVAILILANIDFYPYLSELYSNMFESMPVTQISISNKIRYLGPNVFKYDYKLSRIVFENCSSFIDVAIHYNLYGADVTKESLKKYLGIPEMQQVDFEFRG